MHWSAVLFGIVGALAFLGGLRLLVVRVRTRVAGAVAEGRVVGQKESTVTAGDRASTRGSSKVYAPIVEFTAAGASHRFTSTVSGAAQWTKGTKVEVRYLPDDPAGTAEIGSAGRMFAFPVVAILLGLVFLGVGAWGAGLLGHPPA